MVHTAESISGISQRTYIGINKTNILDASLNYKYLQAILHGSEFFTGKNTARLNSYCEIRTFRTDVLFTFALIYLGMYCM